MFFYCHGSHSSEAGESPRSAKNRFQKFNLKEKGMDISLYTQVYDKYYER